MLIYDRVDYVISDSVDYVIYDRYGLRELVIGIDNHTNAMCNN